MAESPPAPKRHRFGSIVIRKGYATRDQVRECLKIQKSEATRQSLGEILVKKGYLKPEDHTVILRAQHESAPPRRKARAPASKGPLILGIGLGGLPVVALLAVLFWPRSQPAPASASPPPAPTPAPAPGPSPVTKPEPGSLEMHLAECEALQKSGRLPEALRKLAAYDVRNDPDPRTAENKVFEFRKQLESGADSWAAPRLLEVRALVAMDKFRDASARLIVLETLGMPGLVSRSYEALRGLVRERLAQRRKVADVTVRRELEELKTRYEAVKPASNPDEAWARTQELLSRDGWADAVDVLSTLAVLPAWKERALPLRAKAHFATHNFIGVLLDVRLLSDAALVSKDAAEFLNRSLTRAPIDETVLALYEEALRANPLQPKMWEGMVLIHAWRGDTATARRTYNRAIDSGARLDGDTLKRMTDFTESYEETFAAGTALVVQYGGPYEIFTDVGSDEALELAGFLGAVAGEYADLLPQGLNPNFQFRVLYYAKWEDYDRYHRATNGGTSAKDAGARAYYSPTIKQLVIPVALPRTWEKSTKEELMETVRHEAFHQFLDHYSDAPPWFNEGSATYFEKSVRGRPVMNPGEHFQARVALEEFPPLRRMILMNYQEWKHDATWPAIYSQAWSFIHYLHMQGKGALWTAYLDALIMGATREQAFEKVFGGPDFAKLEAGWKRAVTSGKYSR